MKLAILSRNRQLHSIRRLLKEARALRVECHVFDPLDCQIVVGKNDNAIYYHDKELPKIDVVLPRIGTSITEYGLAVVKQFEAMGVKPLNSSMGIADSRNKLSCLQILAQKGFDVPVTVLMRGSRGLKQSLRQVRGTPAVIKLIQGTQGVGVMLAESARSTESVLDTMWSLGQDVILQQYISESRGQDIRVFVVGDKVVASMRRQARDGEFRANIHRGGEGTPVELKESYKKLAVNVVKALGLSVAGVDILESLAGPKVIEVNSSPGFEGIEATTGLNVARMIIEEAIRVGDPRRYRSLRMQAARAARAARAAKKRRKNASKSSKKSAKTKKRDKKPRKNAKKSKPRSKAAVRRRS